LGLKPFNHPIFSPFYWPSEVSDSKKGTLEAKQIAKQQTEKKKRKRKLNVHYTKVIGFSYVLVP